ncbi:HD domain-containing protein [Singulisphaera sp. PoT]|uniref:HD domain-containing protein n=1 Tax=Singulisphaera sp. PoT TaxID=3411797 RepID=UPI003BF45F6A
MISNIKAPDSSIARRAEELARAYSSDMLFNHVMRCYWFAELFAQREGAEVDREMIFLSAVLHDLGLTAHAGGPHRFEIEGAGAAREFLLGQGVPPDRAQKVWDNIALHTWDINYYRDDTSRLMQLGLAYDVVGVAGANLDPADVSEVVRRYPRLDFKRGFNEMLNHEVDIKQPYPHFFHICTRIAHNRSPIAIADAPIILGTAPFDE